MNDLLIYSSDSFEAHGWTGANPSIGELYEYVLTRAPDDLAVMPFPMLPPKVRLEHITPPETPAALRAGV